MWKRGFTFIELVVVMGIFILLASLGSVSFFNTTAKTDLNAVVELVQSDLKSAQSQAMVGKGDQTWTLSTTSAPSGTVISTTFSGSHVVFAHGSGEIQNYSLGNDQIFITHGSQTKSLRLNGLGSIIEVQ